MSQSFSLAGVQEAESKFVPFNKVLPGIHEVEILDVFFQPKGESVKGKKFKDTLATYNQDELIIDFKVIKTVTVEHGDCTGFEGSVSVYEPSGVDANGKACLPEQLSRIVHIFANMAESKDKDKAVTYLQKISGNFKTVSEGIAKVIMGAKRKARFKLVKNKNSTKATFPNYYQGMVECYDVTPSKLSFDVKDKFVTEPVNAEVPTRTDVPNWSVPSPTEEVSAPIVEESLDKLPF